MLSTIFVWLESHATITVRVTFFPRENTRAAVLLPGLVMTVHRHCFRALRTRLTRVEVDGPASEIPMPQPVYRAVVIHDLVTGPSPDLNRSVLSVIFAWRSARVKMAPRAILWPAGPISHARANPAGWASRVSRTWIHVWRVQGLRCAAPSGSVCVTRTSRSDSRVCAAFSPVGGLSQTPSPSV